MKKYIILFIFLFTTFSARVYALTPTEVPEKTPAESQINKLKDRIASRVAELKLVERRGIIGTVDEVTNTQITLTDLQNAVRFVDVDELTKFSSPSAKGTFGISDIAKGQKLGVLGLYNKQSRRLLARFVDVLTIPKIFHGVVTGVASDTFSLNVTTDKEKFLVDVQTTTKTSSYTNGGGLVKSGFSKIKPGQRIMIAGFYDIKDKTKIIPTRIIIFPELPKNPTITIPASQEVKVASASATPNAKKTNN